MKKQQRKTLSSRVLPQCIAVAAVLIVIDVLLMLLMREENQAVTLLCMAAADVLAAVWWIHCMRTAADEPLDELCDALDRYQSGEAVGLDRQLLDREDGIGVLARAVGQLSEEDDERLDEACREPPAQAESRARRSLAEEISQSALPQVLPDIPSRANFEVAGRVERGMGKDCQFYDYFFIDPGLLCVVIGQIPGGSIAEALFMVIAQTTIRSRLRQGRSLEETMADVNAQLYDLGNQFCLNALVATLSTSDGRFTYVNAGQQLPLLMRNEDRYEWLESPVYAPLGMNENVSYRSQELRLKQGDRIFLHTAGLASLPDRDGAAYGAQQLRADLNTSRSQNMESEQLLHFISDSALVFCSDSSANGGFAMLTLLFCKGDKELAHCDVPAQPEYAGEVTEFLKKQFSDNGIDRRHYAREAVVVDEIFALCCRKAEKGSHVMVECGVAPDAQMVNIRVTAVLGGVDPMETETAGTEENAVSFIRDNAEYITFKPGEERDTITIVSFLS